MHGTTRPPALRASRPVALLGLAVALAVPGLAGQAPPPDPLEGFDAYVREAVESWEVPGLSVAVVEDGRVVFARGYGVRSLEEGGAVDEHTLFAIGSTTKAMTAAALGMLVDEGAIAWDDPVVDHLPWFRLSDPYLTAEVTVRDLLTHRAGLGNADFLWYEQDADRRAVVEALRLVEPAYSLRSGFIYQNVMYAAAGAVVEAVSGSPWDVFVRRRILDPLAMERTVTTLADLPSRENVARPHDVVDGEVVEIENASVDPVAPAGSIWSSAGEMASWLAFLLEGCATDTGERLLEPETCDELFEPQAIVRAEFYPTARLTEPSWTTYGLGWFQHDYEGRKVDFHTGSIDGMVAIAGLLREEGVGVYVLANRDHAELRHALMYRVFDLYDPDPPRDWSADLRDLYRSLESEADSARAAAEASRPGGSGPSVPLDRYAGTYRDALYGNVEVDVAPGGEGLRVRYGRLEGTARHWAYDTFRVRWDAEWRGSRTLTFRLDPSGTVTLLEMGGAELERVPQDAPGSRREEGRGR